ncbi:MAG: methyl-accepting chemotaxis protein [Pseudomonadota bacterium]
MLISSAKKTYLKPTLISIFSSIAINLLIFHFLSPALGSLTILLLCTLLTISIVALITYYQIVAPMRACIEHILARAQGIKEEDTLSHGYSHKALQDHYDLGNCYSSVSNTFTNFYAMADKLISNGSSIAIVAAEVSFAAESLSKKVHAEVDDVNNISNSSANISDIVSAAASNAANAADFSTQMHKSSEQGQQIIQSAVDEMRKTNEQAQKTSKIVANLESKSEQIKGITSVISGIAEQTNLLALNAAIEAARAGEQGRGFAVVADEVRMLAKKTAEATQEIGSTVDEIGKDVQNAVDTMSVLVNGIAAGTEVTEQVGEQLGRIHQQAEMIHTQVDNIANGTDHSASEVNLISTAINSVSGHLCNTEKEIKGVVQQSDELSKMAESMHIMLLGFNIQSIHKDIKEAAEKAVAQIQSIFEDAINSGKITLDDLFDRNYKEISNTNPAKYSTRFDKFTDQVLPDIQEPILVDHKQVIYAGAVDNNGYFPTHNKCFSQPLTGNYDTDMLKNRTKRIFDDPTGRRCGSHTASFLLQTYKRDTGEVMHDLSVPVFIKGKHWGGFRMGYQAENS